MGSAVRTICGAAVSADAIVAEATMRNVASRILVLGRNEGLWYHRGSAGDAGWSSPVARWAHNPKVAGSNPAPATKDTCRERSSDSGDLFVCTVAPSIAARFPLHSIRL